MEMGIGVADSGFTCEYYGSESAPAAESIVGPCLGPIDGKGCGSGGSGLGTPEFETFEEMTEAEEGVRGFVDAASEKANAAFGGLTNAMSNFIENPTPGNALAFQVQAGSSERKA